MKVLSSGRGGHDQGDRAEDAREEDEDEGDGDEEVVVVEEVAMANGGGKGTKMRDQQGTLL